MITAVKAEDAGTITMDFTQFNDLMKIEKQLENPSYGIATTMPVKSTEFASMNIKVVKVEDGIEFTCWESNVTTLENISIVLDPGTYKVYTQLEGDDTILEYNNDSEGYVLAPQDNLVIPMGYSPIWEGFILDVPWRIENSEINIPILAVDTGVSWADIYDINVYDHNDGDRLVASTNWSFTQPINSSNTPFFYLFDSISKDSFVQIEGEISIIIKFELHLSPDDWEGPKNVRIATEDIPKLIDWYAGDAHLHTNYTLNAYEFGAPIYATRASNKAMGLDWMAVTDHSFDLNPEKWNVSTADCAAHSDSFFRVLQGEEVSGYLPGTDIIPLTYQYNHLLVYGADFIPGGEWEDGTGSDYTPAEAIAIANRQGGFTYAAHPMYEDAFRDPWQDYSLNFTGLEVWNYGSNTTTDLLNGLANWMELLLSGRHVYIEAGTDAHGNFNGIAGKTRTYVYTESFTEEGILNALKNGHSVMTDGPLVIFDINGAITGNNVSLTNSTNATLHIQWNSTQEFGYINNILVWKGLMNETDETNVTITPSSIGKNALCDEYDLEITPNESCYYRIEAHSSLGYDCYTNPIWIDLVGSEDTTPPEVTIIYPINGSVVRVKNVMLGGFATDDVGVVEICYSQMHGMTGGGGCWDIQPSSKNESFETLIQLEEGENILRATATDEAGNTGSASVTVIYEPEIEETPVLTSVLVSPATAEVTVGSTQQFTATAYDQYGDTMSGVVISWSSTDTSVGTVTPTTATTGSDGTATTTFTALAAGTTTVTANNGTVSHSASVTVEESGVTRTLPSRSQTAGSSLTVSLDVDVGSSTYYAIDEVVPSGWTVTSASGGGDYTSDPEHVKWAVLVGAADTTLTYIVTIPEDATEGDYTFTGTYGMEGIPEATIGGDTTVNVTLNVYDPYDEDQNGVISMTELLSAIGDWKAGSYSMTDLLDTIARWKAGSY